MTVTMHTDPIQVSRDAARAGGMQDKDIDITRMPMSTAPPVAGNQSAPAGPVGYMPGHLSDVMGPGTSATAEKLARGIVAIGGMAAASITRTAAAVGSALDSYTQNLINQTPPLTQPLTISKGYVNRLNLVQKFTQPTAYAAEVMAQYMGELLYWLMQGAMVVYYQLAAMKVLPQITTGGKSDVAGVPMNPVRGGLPMASDELAAFKLVGAALLMAYIEVYDALEEAAQMLFRQASTVGERYLAHRHGGEAADVAAAALSVAADVMTLTLNWFRILGRGFFSKTATKTARTYLLEHVPDLHLD
eukprot:GHRR01001156.1.p1 GENE.GHRR01001156.1~~GHRR01001156.1.p1  ORF type:complete len:303 (+),score=106.55 GHRR01001156.1:254-1162(+)